MEQQISNERITTAGVLIVAGRFFVAKRKHGGSIGNLWEFPGGKHRWGETPSESLQREFKEEFSLEVHVGQCFHSHDFEHHDVLYHLQAFWVEAEEPVRFNLHEHQEARWVTLSELMELEMVPSDVPVRQQVYRYSFA